MGGARGSGIAPASMATRDCGIGFALQSYPLSCYWTTARAAVACSSPPARGLAYGARPAWGEDARAACGTGEGAGSLWHGRGRAAARLGGARRACGKGARASGRPLGARARDDLGRAFCQFASSNVWLRPFATANNSFADLPQIRLQSCFHCHFAVWNPF